MQSPLITGCFRYDDEEARRLVHHLVTILANSSKRNIDTLLSSMLKVSGKKVVMYLDNSNVECKIRIHRRLIINTIDFFMKPAPL